MQVKSIAECSKGNILQYFRPSLIIIKILKFVVSMSGRFTQVLLYKEKHNIKRGRRCIKNHFVRSRDANILTIKVTFFKNKKHETIFD